MWTKCPNCKKVKNYIPMLSWFVTCTDKQCVACKKLEKKAHQEWENEGGPTRERQIETNTGQRLYIQQLYRSQPHYQDSHMS